MMQMGVNCPNFLPNHRADIDRLLSNRVATLSAMPTYQHVVSISVLYHIHVPYAKEKVLYKHMAE